ncbi:unnamed protein product [Caenorhabditis sp. 36 PRJEB53466]|nr:unnamed protein product [Caenorhabditis sp. 36 PRJEB53466]
MDRPEPTNAVESRLQRLLADFNEKKNMESTMREISRLKVPEKMSRKYGLLETIAPFEEDPVLGKFVTTIRKKNEKWMESNRLKRAKYAERKEKEKEMKQLETKMKGEQIRADLLVKSSISPLPNTVQNDGSTAASTPSLDTSLPLSVDIPVQNFGLAIDSNDLLRKQDDPNATPTEVQQEIVTETVPSPLNFGPGLDHGENSPFKPYAQPARPVFDLAAIQRTQHYQRLYQQVLMESHARSFAPNISVEQLLDDMNQLNASNFMLRF